MTMPCHTRMKSTFLQGLLWLLSLQLGFMAVSLEPGYLDFDNLPDTNFSCIGRVVGGYYADIATACQMFHVCTLGQNNETMDIRFLCLNGTVFEQSTRVCERIDEVDCEKSEQYYHLNNELYGGMDPLIIRGETEPMEPLTTPSATSSTSTTASTSTTPNPYFGTTKQTTSHQNIPVHYTSDSPADIRFDPKIINLQLNSDPSLGANIKPVSYQQQSYDDKNHHTIVTTHSYQSDIPKTIYDNYKGQNLKPTDLNYEFEYQDQQDQYSNQANRKSYQNVPSYSPSGAELDDYSDDIYKGSTYRTVYHTPSSKASDSSTYKTPITYTSSSNPQYSFDRTEVPIKQQQQQVTAPPSIFSALSSPAPFTHPHHLEAKRNTDHHKIKKSFSLSISDQNGRELIKVNNTPISAIFPESYLDYKDEDATLLPIFEDVPRLEKRRPKRNTEDSKRVFKADPEAADVLKFLADWYTNYEKTTKVSVPLTSEAITEINDELSIAKDTSENDLKEDVLNKENNETDYVSDLQKRENEYYDDDEYYYDLEDYSEEEANKTSSNITVSHKELENIDDRSMEINNHTNSTIGDENSKNLTYNYLDEYVDDNYEPETYNDGSNNTLPDSNKTETDKNEIPRETITTPNILNYDYVDDNYEPLIHDNNPESAKNISSDKIVKEFSTSTTVSTTTIITSTTTPTTSSTNIIEAEFDEILTTDSILSTTTEDNSKVIDTSEDINATNFNMPSENITDATNSEKFNDDFKEFNIDDEDDVTAVKHRIADEIESEHLKNDTSEIHSEEPIETDDKFGIIQDEDVGTTEIAMKNREPVINDTKHSEEYITSSTTTESITSTSESLPSMTTLHYYSQLPTEQTTPAVLDDSQFITETILTTSSTTYKPDHAPTEVPIITSSYPATEVSEPLTETTYVSEKIHTTTVEVPVVMVKENLNDMIKDIEVETKSIAATIVVPETKEALPSASNMPKLENTPSTESVEHITTVPTTITTSSEAVTSSQAPTSITTPKLIETTARLHFGRGRHTYFTRKTTTTSRPSHRFNLQQQRRRFDTYRNRSRFSGIQTTDQKTLNHSVNDVNTILDNYNSTSTTTVRTDSSTVENNSISSIIDNNQTTPAPLETSSSKNYEKKFVPLHKTEAITDASLSKSANPTLAKETKHFLATTPISKHIRVKFKKERVNKKYMFTCFDKKIDKFYSDPRDCRLFHYCSQGYTSNQLVDMKFVCDLGTYFDDVKLICTETKPARCL